MGTNELVITGGEPLLRKDLPNLLDYIPRRIRVLIATNGISLTSGLLSKITKPNVRIQVSLDSTDRQINDTLRGKGAYDGAMNAINLCLSQSMPLQISTTVTNLNYSTIPDVINFGFSATIPVKLRQFVAKGRGNEKEIRQSLMVTDEQLEKLLSDYVLNPAYKGLVSAEQMPFHQSRGVYRCSAGNSIMYIRSDGCVGPCPSVEGTIGNVNSKPIKEIWNSNFDTFRNKNYKPCGFCGRDKVLLPKNKKYTIFGGAMSFREFTGHGCKCTG